MLVLRDKDSYGRAHSRIRQLPFHIKALGQLFEFFVKSGFVQIEFGQFPLDAHEKQPEVVILMLIGVKNICAVSVQETGDLSDDSFLVGAMNQQNSGVRHSLTMIAYGACAAGGVKWAIGLCVPHGPFSQLLGF